MIRYFFTKQFLKFLIVGGLAAFCNWISCVILNIWFSFSLSVVLSYAIGMSTAFLLNSFFVFPKSLKTRHVQARNFILVNMCVFPLVWFLAIQINNQLQFFGIIKYSQVLAHAFAILVPMFATFLVYKFYAFQEKSYE